MMFNRLWPLAVFTILSGVVGFFVPQVPVVATGFCLLVALLLRRESSAVAAIEGRDGVEFWFDKSSPFGAPKLLRLPGLRRIEPALTTALKGDRPGGVPYRDALGQEGRPPQCCLFRSFASSSQGRVFATCSGLIQARRAVATP